MSEIPNPLIEKSVSEISSNCAAMGKGGVRNWRWSNENEYSQCNVIYEGKTGRYVKLHHLHKTPLDKIKCCLCGLELTKINEEDWPFLEREGLI